jgi:hypothetical protein
VIDGPDTVYDMVNLLGLIEDPMLIGSATYVPAGRHHGRLWARKQVRNIG